MRLKMAMGNGPGFLQQLASLLGGVALRLIDAVVPHLHLGNDISKAEGDSTS